MASHPHFLWSDLFKKRRTKQSHLIESLQSNIVFSTLKKRELVHVADLVHERVYEPEEVIFYQNDRGFGLYLLVKGSVSIRTRTPEGELLISNLTKGSFFGELSLIEPENIRTATARANERTTVIGFFKPDLIDLMESKPEMGVKILYQLAMVIGRRLIETTERISLLTQARGLGKSHENIL